MDPKPMDMEKLAAIIDAHRDRKWSLIPMLQEIQEAFGFIPPEAIEPVARGACRCPRPRFRA